jgi:hypothetical protein
VHDEEAYLDRTVNEWHRHVFGPLAHAHDVDLVGRCPLPLCRAALYVIEATQSARHSRTYVLLTARSLAARPVLVLHDGEHVTSAVDLVTERTYDGEPAAAEFLTLLRLAHAAESHAGTPALARQIRKDLRNE